VRATRERHAISTPPCAASQLGAPFGVCVLQAATHTIHSSPIWRAHLSRREKATSTLESPHADFTQLPSVQLDLNYMRSNSLCAEPQNKYVME
jgi:hypothetical protein